MVARVLHVVERYLEVSAGFVHQHIANSRYDSLVVSRFTPTNTDAFPVTNLRSMPGWVTALPRPLADRALRAWVLKKATGAGVDIGHAHFGYALPYTRILKRRADIPVVLSLHGDDATAWAWANGWAFAPDPGLTAAVIVPSKWFVPFATKLGFAEERVHVIPSGVDTAFFTPLPMPTDGPPVVAFVGRLVEKKGVDVLMAAWPAVRAAVPDARLRLAGDASPDLMDALLSRIPEPDRGSIRFLGSLDTADLAGEYSSAWVSVMPAVLEALGLSTLESLACGTPVVGADSGTTAALLADPAAGRLFRPAEPDDLARAVIEQLAATDRVDRDRCRGLTDAYDWERITDRVEAAYLALAG